MVVSVAFSYECSILDVSGQYNMNRAAVVCARRMCRLSAISVGLFSSVFQIS